MPRARTVANIVLGTAGVAAAYVVVTTPPLRRLAFRVGRYALAGRLPFVLLTTIGRAWRAAERP